VLSRPVASSPVASSARTRRAAATDAYDFNIPKVVGAVAVVWQLAVVAQVIAYLHDYRQPAVIVAVWLGLLAAAAWLIPRARAGGLTAAEAAWAIAIAVAAVALVGWERRLHGAGGPVDWSVVGSGWLLALVAISRPARAWICGAVLVFAAHAIFAIRVLGATTLDLARLSVTAYSLVIILAVFAALRPATAAYARLAARRSALVSQSASERAAAAAVRADQSERLALLETEALPLLRGIADGTLAVTDGGVRQRCASYAATLRRALVDRAGEAGGLLAELAPVLSSARDRGTPAELQLLGDLGSPPREVASATVAAVDGVLRALPPHPVTLTVLVDEEDVELFVTFDQPPDTVPDLAALNQSVPAVTRWHAAVEVGDTGAGCLEVRWRTGAAP
jgi:uncharacterized membrane protein (UPF0136 family)